MKQILIAVISFLCCMPVLAQNSWEIKEKRDNNVYVNANFTTIPFDCPTVNPIGASVGIAHNFKIGKQGLFTEAGVELGYQQGRSDFGYGTTEKVPFRFVYKNLNGRIPLNIGYKLPIGDQDMALSIYAGANIQYYLFSKESWRDYKDNMDWETELLDTKLHYGLQAGANLDFNQEWFAGAEFSYNLSKMCTDELDMHLSNKLHTFNNNPNAYAISLRIGYRFR